MTVKLDADILALHALEDVLNDKSSKNYSMPEILVTIENVTQDMARDLIQKNEGNRSISEQVVNRYKRDMISGNWTLTHQPVAFGPDEQIIDGQHRLTAIARCSAPVRIMVARYTNEASAAEARLAIDLGRGRRMGDILEIGSIADRGVGKRAASFCYLMMQADKFEGSTYTHAEMKQFYIKNKVSIDYAARLPKMKFQAVVASAFAYAHTVNPTEVEKFVELVQEQFGYDHGSPAHLFVKAMTDGTFSAASCAGRTGRMIAVGKVLRLIHLHVVGKTLSKLQRGDEGVDYFRSKRASLGL